MMVKGAKGRTHSSSVTLIANVSKVHQKLIRDHLILGALREYPGVEEREKYYWFLRV